MKNHCKDADYCSKRCTITEKNFSGLVILRFNKKALQFAELFMTKYQTNYFTAYTTSLTSFTVLVTSGSAAFTRLPA